MPTAALMPELIAAYPEAKAIIAMRDPDAWWTSLEKSVGKQHKELREYPSFIRNILMRLDPFFLKRFAPLLEATKFGPFGQFGFQDPEHCKRVYIAMHEEVRNMVVKENMLEYQLEQGWGPLCNFLGRDVPEIPFPHINDSVEFDERMWLIKKHIAIRIARRLFPIFIVITMVGYIISIGI